MFPSLDSPAHLSYIIDALDFPDGCKSQKPNKLCYICFVLPAVSLTRPCHSFLPWLRCPTLQHFQVITFLKETNHKIKKTKPNQKKKNSPPMCLPCYQWYETCLLFFHKFQQCLSKRKGARETQQISAGKELYTKRWHFQVVGIYLC